ncbi:MAG: hypothetical protein KI790_13465 [Cyclobacteriaceae bacterium]|nr:hypothetical protein [Cyclobacteriaceae bacterium HetDA_MAG_MS6]
MKIPVIKKLVESYSLDQLRKAEEDIADEKAPAIEVKGDDTGEQLTHAYAAIQVLEAIEQGDDLKTALRSFTARVRGSIG